MVDNHLEETRAAKSAVEQLVEQRVQVARQEDILSIYEDLVGSVWDRLVPTLGRSTVMAVMERALALTAEKYPAIELLSVTRDGLAFQNLREQLTNQDPDRIRRALKEFVVNVIDLLAMLTGDIIVRHVLRDIERSTLGV